MAGRESCLCTNDLIHTVCIKTVTARTLVGVRMQSTQSCASGIIGTFAKYILKIVVKPNLQRSYEKYIELDVYSDARPALTFLFMLKCVRVWVCNDKYAYTHEYLCILYIDRMCMLASGYVFIYLHSHSCSQVVI